MMPVNRSNQSRTFVKPRALNSLKKSADKQSKPPSTRSVKKCSSPPSVNSGYSLYSSESSSGGVGSINRGLDRCAALLANILDEEDDDSFGLPSKIPSTAKKTSGVTRPVSKVKQTNRGVTRFTKQTQSAKKNKQKQPITSKKTVGSTPQQHVKRQHTKTTNKPSKTHKDTGIQERSMPQATQFNNRLVSSTPDMGSPTSTHDDNPRHNGVTEVVIRPAQSDPSLEALAAQIRLLRSQAEIAESSQQPSTNLPPSELITTQSNGIQQRLQEPSVINTSVVNQEKIDFDNEPEVLLRSLSNRLRDLNTRQQGVPLSNQTNQQTFPNETPNHQQHIFHRPHEDNSHIPGGTLLTTSAPSVPTYQHTHFEPPGSANVSFLGEYHQLPDQNVDTIPTREQCFNHIATTLKSSEMSVQQQNPPTKLQNKILTNQGLVHTDNPTPSPHHNKSTKPPTTLLTHPPQGTQRNTFCPDPKTSSVPEKEQLNKFDKPCDVQTMCTGTQTYSPPADKCVQTSTPSSPSSSLNPSSGRDDSSNAEHHDAVIDTPHPPQHTSHGKKSASWEQMRVLKYLIGELRAALCELGKDKEVERLLTEIQDCLDTLQYLPPDLQAEVALALQPLRSENSQLRRRLRIANQQIRQLEQRSDKENGSPLVDVEVLTLQSLNAKLQKDLREEISKQKSLAASTTEHKTIAENLKQKNRDLMMLLQQKDNHQLDSRQEWLEEKSSFTHQLTQIASQKDELQLVIDALNKEKNILQLSLQQRDAEINRLKQDPEINYPEQIRISTVYDKNNLRISSDDDDNTPTASPRSSQAPRHHKEPRSPHHRTRLYHTDALGHSIAYPHQDPQGVSKKVTFAEHQTPVTNQYNTDETSSRHPWTGGQGYNTDGARIGDQDEEYYDYSRLHNQLPQPSTEYRGREPKTNFESTRLHLLNQLPQTIDSTTEYSVRQPRTDTGLSYTQSADTDFAMRKFLSHSGHYVSDVDALSGPDSRKHSNVYTPRDTTSAYKHPPAEESHHHKSYYSQFNHLPPQAAQKASQNTIFQGSVLDGSISGIDTSAVVSESTQSSVTSQYEAQFQLGLASLDTEIEKLQNSLKSMGNGKL